MRLFFFCRRMVNLTLMGLHGMHTVSEDPYFEYIAHPGLKAKIMSYI